MKLSNVTNVLYKKPSFLSPEKVVEELGIRDGDAVADYGTGVGFWTIPISKKVGEKGKVYAFSANPEFISLIEKKARLQGLNNIETKKIELDKGKIKSKKVDFVIISNILHISKKPELVLKNAKSLLKLRGKIVIIDFLKLKSVFGPPLHTRLSEGEVITMAEKAGLHFKCTVDAGWYHYGMLFDLKKK